MTSSRHRIHDWSHDIIPYLRLPEHLDPLVTNQTITRIALTRFDLTRIDLTRFDLTRIDLTRNPYLALIAHFLRKVISLEYPYR